MCKPILVFRLVQAEQLQTLFQQAGPFKATNEMNVYNDLLNSYCIVP